MEGFNCKKCSSNSFFTKPNGPHIALYCADCGAYIKNLSKNEARLFEQEKGRVAEEKQQYEANTIFQYALAIKNFCTINQCNKGCPFYYRSENVTCALDVDQRPDSWPIYEATQNDVTTNNDNGDDLPPWD